MKGAGSLLLGAGIAAGLYAIFRKGSGTSPGPAPAPTPPAARPCDSPPPSPQPAVPAGFAVFRGAVDEIAQGVANNLLGNAIGDSEQFTDGQGRTLLALSHWHCNNDKNPRGWHKGVTLFERVR